MSTYGDELYPYFARFWKGTRPMRDDLTDPTPSAAFGVARSSGGAYGKVLGVETGLPTTDKTFEGVLSRHIVQEGLVSYLDKMVEVAPGVVETQRSHTTLRRYAALREQLTKKIAKYPVAEGATPYEDPEFFADWSEEPAVEAHAVLEPLKVRMITKGPARTMWYNRRLQRTMWNHLQDIPSCVLTGKPLERSDLEDLVRRTKKIKGLEDFNLIGSGDFSAATDNLKMDYTKMSFELLLDVLNVPESERFLYRRVLYEQKVYYRDPDFLKFMQESDLSDTIWKTSPDGKTLYVQQRNGQLMGSVLSFPVLCSVNLVVYWHCLELYLGRKIKLEDLPVLINGDDILFFSNEKFYALWKRVTDEVGFELSVGKNYIHEHLAMVNSEPYWYSEGAGFVPIRYLNVGLLTGQSKLSGRLETRTSPVWDYYNQVLAGATNRPRAHLRFLQLNRDQLEGFTVKGLYNLFVDPFYGGLGFDLYPEVKPLVRFTTFQRQFGHFLRSKVDGYDGANPPGPQLGIIREKGQKVTSLIRRHYGRYELRRYHRTGTIDHPEYTLLLDVEERLPVDRSVRASLLGHAPDIEQREYLIRRPKPGVLREFRAKKPVIRSVGSLLTCPREWVELAPGEDLNGVMIGNQPKTVHHYSDYGAILLESEWLENVSYISTLFSDA